MPRTDVRSWATSVSSWDYEKWTLPVARRINRTYQARVDSLEVLNAAQIGGFSASSTWDPAKGPAPAWARRHAFYAAMDVVSFYLPQSFARGAKQQFPRTVPLDDSLGCETLAAPETEPFADDLSCILRPLNSLERQVTLLRFHCEFPQVDVASTMRLSTRQVRNIEARIRSKVPHRPEPWSW